MKNIILNILEDSIEAKRHCIENNIDHIIQAMKAAQKAGVSTIGMTGRAGKLAGCVDLVFAVASDTTARIQESHITVGHILCDLVDRILYPDEFRD